ncbi:MFS transporter [bacterium]|nr:MFS transporter [bacterium]
MSNWTRWVIRLCFVAYGLTFASWASRIPQIKGALHLTDGELGRLLFAMPVGQLISLQFSGRIAVHFGSHRVMPLALCAYALVLPCLGMARAPWQLALGLLLFGLCGNIGSTSLQTQGVLTEKEAGRPLMASYHGAWSLAGFLGGALGLLMTSFDISPAAHFTLVAALVVALVPWGKRFLIVSIRPASSVKRRFDPGLLVLGLMGFCTMGMEGCMFDWSGVYFREVVHAPRHLSALGYTSFMVTTALGRFTGDRVIGRFGRVRVLQIGGLLASSGFVCSVLFPSLLPAILSFVLIGIGVCNIMPSVYSLAGQSRPEDPSNALASVGQISFLGFLLGPPLIGEISSRLGLPAAFLVIACLGLLVPGLARRVKL